MTQGTVLKPLLGLLLLENFMTAYFALDII